MLPQCQVSQSAARHSPVIVKFAAWATRSRVTHLPKVILLTARNHMIRIGEQIKPQLLGLAVLLKILRFISLEVSSVEAVGVQAIDVDK